MGWLNSISGMVSGAPMPLPAKLAALALDFGVRVASDAIQNRPITPKRLLNRGLQTLGSSLVMGKNKKLLNSVGAPLLKSLFGQGRGGIPNRLPSSSVVPLNTSKIPQLIRGIRRL